ncbi:hypothetical protein O0L34_g12966 [Tuta absoluta]|nr:hypothetical protein O0L34_g12965 [Tuta absoluta]KAJ2937568.1 hypothetical protein O0L34_g12966 [Tuta absoluta]
MALARTLCINCNIAADGLRHYHFNAMDMDLEIVSLIEEWTAREVADGDNICQECFDLLVIELNNRSEGNIGERQFGSMSKLSLFVYCAVCQWSDRQGDALVHYVAELLNMLT